MKPFTKKIVLENGREFYGYGFGADREAINEIVFNTSMVGYQEIMSDPSYTDQMVVMTYPLIGNYGMTDEDYETKNPTIGGMIVREYNDSPSNFRYTKTLNEVFEEYGIPAIWGVDTRTLTRIIRNEGSQKVHDSREKLPFIDQADGVLLSFRYKMIKPDDAIYQKLFELFSLKPEECLFFDDKQENIDGAVRNKMNGHVFTSYEDAMNTIKNM